MKTAMWMLLLALIFFRASTYGFSQQPVWDWAIKASSSGVNEKCVAADAAGNIYVAGMFLTKYTPAGSMVWTVNLQTGTGQVVVKGITTDLSGNVYLAGHFGSTALIGGIAITSYGHTDIFIAKLSANGQGIWARHAGSTSPPPVPMPPIVTDGAFGLSVDGSGNSYIVGQYGNQAGVFDQITMPPPTAGVKFFVAKYDASGQVQWVRDAPRHAFNIAAVQNGSYYIAGGQADIFIEKYNVFGTLEWQRNAGGTQTYGYAAGLCVDMAGDAYITGTKDGLAIFGPYTLSGSMFLVKYDAAGTVLWAQTNQGSSGCWAVHAAINNAGHVFVTGFFKDTLSFGGNTQVLVTDSVYNDIYVARFSALTGAADWALQAKGPANDLGMGICALPNGDCAVTGTFMFSCTFGTVTLTNPAFGGTEFLARVSENPLSISELNSGSLFNLYPNPATVLVTFNSGNLKQGYITIYNIAGKKVYEAQLKPALKIHIENWPAGIYAVQVTSDKKTLTQKLVVSR